MDMDIYIYIYIYIIDDFLGTANKKVNVYGFKAAGEVKGDNYWKDKK